MASNQDIKKPQRKADEDLQECFAHGGSLTISAVNGNASHNDQSQMLFPDGVNDFAELLCTSG